MDLTAKALERS